MTATNHALTGALVGLAIVNPVVAVPLAFLSHYVLDMIPHYGRPEPGYIKSLFFRNLLVVDAALCLLLVIILAIVQPQYWLLACICAFLATSPDIFWLNKYRKSKQGLPWRPNWHSRFAAKIQWYEKPEGALVEFAWFCMAVALLLGFF